MNEINNQNNLELPPTLTDIRQFLSWETLKVESEGDCNTAGEYLKVITLHIDLVKEKQDEMFGPLKKAIKEFEKKVKFTVLDPLSKVDVILRKKVQLYWDKEHARKEAEEKKKRDDEAARLKLEAEKNMNTAMETGSEVAAETALNQQKEVARLENSEVKVRQSVKTNTFNMAQMRVWTWRILDEKKIPKEYFILDEKKINSIARGFDKNPILIDGVEFYQESRVSMRT